MTLEAPRIAVLIPSFNDESFIATTLLSIFHEAAQYQEAGGTVHICVVNDGSTDRTAAVINGMRHFSPSRFTVINRAETKGTAYSLSEAFVACATGSELVLRADADARFIHSGWLRPMISFLTSDARIGIVAPMSVAPDGTIESHGVNYLPAGRTVELRDREYGGQPIAGLVEVDAVLGEYSLMRTADWEIDTVYVGCREDEDQCLALRRRGRKCFSMGSLSIVHYRRMRWARVSDRMSIARWQQRHAQRLKSRPGRWREIRSGTRLVAAGVLPGFAKKAIRTVVPRPPKAARPRSQAVSQMEGLPRTESARMELAWHQDSQHFAHKWGFPSIDAWSEEPAADRQTPQAEIDALARSRAAILLRDRYTPDGMAEAAELVERYLGTAGSAGLR